MLRFGIRRRFLIAAQHQQQQRWIQTTDSNCSTNQTTTTTTTTATESINPPSPSTTSTSPTTHIGTSSSSSSSSSSSPPPIPPPLRERPSALTDEIIRVDHAGELGADRIYAGQMAILGNGPMGKTIAHMWEQEKAHRQQFEQLIQQHRVRPTVMTPIWNVAGFVLGAGTALMGEKAAMACTVAVETVIVEHYNEQLRQIMESPKPDKELLATITKFRDEEQEHHDTGIEYGAEQAPFYKAMTEVIKFGCKTAIAISKRI